MSVPRERTGEPVVVRLGDQTLSGRELREAIGGFELAGVTRALLGPQGTEYEMPFETIDAALIAIEIDDFVQAIRDIVHLRSMAVTGCVPSRTSGLSPKQGRAETG